uniref:Mesoderm induction early response protein 1 n=1 Tax=Anopheles atroparvus TaxID=41427 RepID=A0AAG5DSV4_ANOAO
MPAEEEQLHQPGTSDEQQTPTPQSEPTALPQATCKQQEVPEAEQKPIEKDHREENADCEKRELPKVENQPHAVEQEPERHTASETPEHQHGGTVVSAVKEETKTHDISLTSAQSATEQPEKEEKAEPTSPPVKSGTNASEESAVGEKVAVDEEDEEDEDDEDEAPENEEQEERERSREDGFNNEEERAVVHSTQPHQQQHNNRQDQSQTPTGGQYYEDDEEDEEEEGEERSELRQLFEPINDSQVQSEDEEDGDYIPDEEVKKTIMVGSDFQAVIPEGLCRYDDALPYENEDKLLWNPTILNEQEIVDYLLKITSPTVGTSLTTGGAATAAGGGTGGGVGGQQQQQQKNSTGAGSGPDPQTNSVYAIPLGNHLRDDEQSLYLLQQCGHNIDEALRRRRITSNAVPVPEQQMSIWSEEECRNFENGLRVHGKDFHMIQQTKVRTRSVGELVQFYYLWKKTERHDLFASKARLDKKKYNLHPGLTDHMDRFLEEQENSTGFGDRSSSPGFSSLYNSASEAKRQRLLDSKENNNTASSKRGAASNL